jgi:DNA primase
MLSTEQRHSLTVAAENYHNSLNEQTASYLKSRGITKEIAGSFLLGTVTNPIPGHEHAVGCLSIPYLTKSGVVGVKFRKVDGGSPKYLWATGQKIGMFNVPDLFIDSETIAICEGEIDTIILSGICNIPAIGVAGVSNWKPWFPIMFEGYKNVLIFADNDVKEDGRNPGMELGLRIKEDLNNATIIHLPDNQDVNDVYLKQGVEWFKEKVA